MKGTLHHRLLEFHLQYGSPVRVAPNELSFTDPSAWKDIYAFRASDEHKTQLQKDDFFYPPQDPRLPGRIISLPDQQHMRLRRQLAPAFTGKGIEEFEPILHEYSDLFITQVVQASQAGPVDVVQYFSWMTTDVIGELALGTQFECLENRKTHPWAQALRDALPEGAVASQLNRFGLLPLLTKLMPGDIIELQEKFISFTLNTMHERVVRGDNPLKPDFVTLMQREMKFKHEAEPLAENEMAINAAILVAAGSESTSALLSALVYYLGKTTSVKEKLTLEIRTAFPKKEDITAKGLMQLEYLQVVIDEVLRLIPPAPMLPPRVTSVQGNTVNGVWIPPKTVVGVSLWACGHMKQNFEDPEEFRPERWLPNITDSAKLEQMKQSIRPFSIGPRNCIGQALAQMDVRLGLAKFLWNFDFDLVDTTKSLTDGVPSFLTWYFKPLMVNIRSARI